MDYAPLSGVANDQSFEIEGRPILQGAQPPDEEIRIVTPGWFESLRIPVARGRVFRATDGPEALPVVTINEALARRYWPGADPLGQRFQISGDPRWWTVVGVVGNIREFGLDADVRPTFYEVESTVSSLPPV